MVASSSSEVVLSTAHMIPRLLDGHCSWEISKTHTGMAQVCCFFRTRGLSSSKWCTCCMHEDTIIKEFKLDDQVGGYIVE
jgi:hypothetical protein